MTKCSTALGVMPRCVKGPSKTNMSNGIHFFVLISFANEQRVTLRGHGYRLKLKHAYQYARG